MDTLFISMPEIQDYVTVDISGNFKTIKPYLVEAHKWLGKGMDKPTMDALIQYINEAEAEADPDYDALKPYAQRVLANFAYAIAAKRLGIFIGENGMMEYGNSTLTPISAEKLEMYQKEFFISGYNALEQLILFIEANSETYPDTYAYLFDNSFFVRTAADMNALIFTDVQNRDYFDMKPEIFLIETEIEGTIGSETFTDLKDVIVQGNADEQQTTMINYARQAEACLAYGSKFKSEKHTLKGRELMERLRLYYTSITQNEVERWTNEDKTIFVFGG